MFRRKNSKLQSSAYTDKIKISSQYGILYAHEFCFVMYFIKMWARIQSVPWFVCCMCGINFDIRYSTSIPTKTFCFLLAYTTNVITQCFFYITIIPITDTHGISTSRFRITKMCVSWNVRFERAWIPKMVATVFSSKKVMLMNIRKSTVTSLYQSAFELDCAGWSSGNSLDFQISLSVCFIMKILCVFPVCVLNLIVTSVWMYKFTNEQSMKCSLAPNFLKLFKNVKTLPLLFYSRRADFVSKLFPRIRTFAYNIINWLQSRELSFSLQLTIIFWALLFFQIRKPGRLSREMQKVKRMAFIVQCFAHVVLGELNI